MATAFVNMRLGQCYFELGDRARSEEHLLRAYLLDQERVFKHEDPKYLRSIQKNLR